MKNMIDEFKDFINKGDVVMVAVGLILALTFKDVVDTFIKAVIDPIIAAIFGESSLAGIGFDIGDARISIGLVLDAIITFVMVGFILFLMVKAYNTWKSEDDDDSGPSEVELLTEIRDSLQNR